MTEFRNNRELRRIDFDLRAYQLDAQLNDILKDLEHSSNAKLLKKHILTIGGLLEDYYEIQLSAIPVTKIDVEFLRQLQSKLVDKYCDLIWIWRIYNDIKNIW